MRLAQILLSGLLILMVFFVTGCPAEEEPGEETQPEEEMPEELAEIEAVALAIMQQADLIPAAQLAAEESDNEQANNNEDEEDGDSEDGNNNEDAQGEEGNEGKTVTADQTILGEVLRREMEVNADENPDDEDDGEEDEQQLPEDTSVIWDDIAAAVTEIHDQWDELKPQLLEENIAPEEIDSFEESLDSLTVFSAERDYFATIVAANELTAHFPSFMTPFADNSLPKAYELKYHNRHVLLSMAEDNYNEARASLDYMVERLEYLSADLEENDEGEIARQLELSLDNLRRAVNKENFDLVRIKAAVVMDNIVQAMEELEPEENN